MALPVTHTSLRAGVLSRAGPGRLWVCHASSPRLALACEVRRSLSLSLSSPSVACAVREHCGRRLISARSLHTSAPVSLNRKPPADSAAGQASQNENDSPAPDDSAPPLNRDEASNSSTPDDNPSSSPPPPAARAQPSSQAVPTGKKVVRKRKREIEPNPNVTDLTFKYPPGSKAAEAYEALMDSVRTSRTSSSRLNDGSGHRPATRKWYKSPVAILLAMVPILTFWLGVWQVQRLQWKLNLIEELEDKLLDVPLQLPRNVNLKALDDFSFRLVNVRGRFDTTPGAALILGPRVRDGITGYNVIVPFIRVDEEGNEMPPILVNRGFVSDDHFEKNRVPEELKATTESRSLVHPEKIYQQPDQVTPQSAGRRGSSTLPWQRQTWSEWIRGQPAGSSSRSDQEGALGHNGADKYITLTTILPRIYPNNMFVPTNLPGSNEWFSIDPYAMSVRLKELSRDPRVTEGPGLLPIYVEEVFDGPHIDALHHMTEGYPLGKPKVIEIRNQHATYAFTWFSLSAFTAIGWLYIKASRYGRK